MHLCKAARLALSDRDSMPPAPDKSKCSIIVQIQIALLGQMLTHLRVRASIAGLPGIKAVHIIQ
jgi:hypothetical protein